MSDGSQTKDSSVEIDAAEEFDAAKSIYDKLKPFQRARQERVLRWVSEILGIAIPTPAKAAIATLPVPATHKRSDDPATDRPLPPVPDLSSPAARIRVGGAPDIRSFVEEKNPQTDIHFVSAVAYYFRFSAPTAERRETIDADFAQQSTRMAGRPRLTNPTSTLVNAMRRGYLNSAGRGEYSISTVGETFI